MNVRHCFKVCVCIAIVVMSILMSAFICRKYNSEINKLKISLIKHGKLQEKLDNLNYSYSLSDIDLKEEFWFENSDKDVHLFFVISDLNCSVCLDKFMKQCLEIQDSIDEKYCTLLVLNGSKEIISRYKRVYKIKIPIFPCDEKLLSRIMEEFNTPFAFISDKDKKIMHLYNEKTKLPFDEYFQILKRRYFILKKD